MNEKKEMYQYVAWFQENYPELTKEMMSSMHNYAATELNPYHLESDCWSHTMMVCKVAEMKGFSPSVLASALLHDIGKPLSRTVKEETHRVRFFGHEVLSSSMSAEIVHKMYNDGLLTLKEAEETLMLICYHAELYKNTNPESIYEKFKYDKNMYINLTALAYSDNMGRFVLPGARGGEGTVKEVLALFESKTEVKRTYTHSVEILCGANVEARSAYAEERCQKDSNILVFSKESEIEDYTLAQIEGKHIILNLENLSKESRQIWLKHTQNGYEKSAHIFTDTLDNARVSKVMQYPLYDEVERYSFHF